MKVGEDGRWGASAETKGQWGLRMVIRNLTSLTSSRLHSEHEEPIPARLAEASERTDNYRSPADMGSARESPF